ncbi:MAG: hypothetical protein QW717_03110 [Candidatus Bathyarchaeia archaeon]
MLHKQEKAEKTEELRHKLSILEEEKRKLDAEAEELIKKRDGLREKYKRLKFEILRLKNARDEINAEVKMLKQQRSQVKAEVSEKIRELRNVQTEIEALTGKKPYKSAKQLQKEIETYEWKIQTTPLNLQEEKQLIEHIKQLGNQLNILRKIRQLNQEKLELKSALKAMEAKVKLVHGKIVEQAEKSRQHHEEMLKKIGEAEKIKSEANSVHILVLEAKAKAKPLQDEIIRLEKMIMAEEERIRRKREENLVEKIAKEAEEKLKRGEKLTLEQFKVFMEKNGA